MDNNIKILGPNGEPIESKPKLAALNGPGKYPYDAADRNSNEFANWDPALWSPDNEINGYRDTIVARMRDLARNDGWVSGSITRILDNAIGASFRPLVKPDYRALAMLTGNKRFDATWADEYGRVIEAHWRLWAKDPNKYCDIERKQSVSQMLRLAFRHKLVDGDALAVLHYHPERVNTGSAKYGTMIQIVDSDRLSNPDNVFDMPHIRGGVEIDPYGAPIAYHIRKAHEGDWWSGSKTMTWERVPRETSWGRPITIHDFDLERGSQHRGIGILTPVVQRLKMLIKYDQTELEAAIINAIFGAYIESPFDHTILEEGLSAGDFAKSYQGERSSFHKDTRLSLSNGARIPILFPGEKIDMVSAARPNSNFKEFESAVLRNASAAIGISSQQLTQDWSDVNYSSARAALLEAWKTLTRRRIDFSEGFAQPILMAFVEEIHSDYDLPLPNNAPDFIEARTAYSRAQWMGPGRGWIDPVAEKKGSILAMNAGLSTLEIEASENVGEDWEELIDQRAREIKAFKERGLTLPSWAEIDKPDNTTVTNPEVK